MRRLILGTLLAVGCGDGSSTRADSGGGEDAGRDADADSGGGYACGWTPRDPGDLVATGAAEGDTIANAVLVDQCGERVPLWDFAGEYHVLFLTAAW